MIAFPLVKKEQLLRFLKLKEKANIQLILDSVSGAELLDSICKLHSKSVEVLLKVNVGLNRCGVDSLEESVKLVKKHWRKNLNLKFKGLLSHAGHSYGTDNIESIKRIAKKETDKLVEIKNRLAKRGSRCNVISVGATPTAKFSINKSRVTELRPGNFIFYDNTQISLGVVQQEQCALKVVSTVVSKRKDRVIIDAGSKTLGLDKGAHGNQSIKGYGKIINNPSCEIISLSEEHGIVQGKKLPGIGEQIEIIPNHSCVVMNLNENIYLKRNGKND